jgi:hypothetical protein
MTSSYNEHTPQTLQTCATYHVHYHTTKVLCKYLKMSYKAIISFWFPLLTSVSNILCINVTAVLCNTHVSVKRLPT